MLTGIHPAISPDLLKALAEMGHGDELVLADAHFPGHSLGRPALRADGVSVATLLEGILPLFELDTYAQPLVMMAPVSGDQLDPAVEEAYLGAIRRHCPRAPGPQRVAREDFYDRARRAFVIVMTGERAKYGNIILKKGVTPTSQAFSEH
ncbi:MAG: L-fucose mutarotase [Chthoniobacterales bacterium]